MKAYKSFQTGEGNVKLAVYYDTTTKRARFELLLKKNLDSNHFDHSYFFKKGTIEELIDVFEKAIAYSEQNKV